MEENFDKNFATEDFNDETNENGEVAAIEGESKADKFRRIASHRTNNALKQITGIGKLSTSAYEYTPEQVEKIFGALQQALDDAKSRFEKKPNNGPSFSL